MVRITEDTGGRGRRGGGRRGGGRRGRGTGDGGRTGGPRHGSSRGEEDEPPPLLPRRPPPPPRRCENPPSLSGFARTCFVCKKTGPHAALLCCGTAVHLGCLLRPRRGAAEDDIKCPGCQKGIACEQILSKKCKICKPPKDMAVDNVEDMQKLGLWAVGFCPKRQNVSKTKNERRFRSHFGVDAVSIFKMWVDLEEVEPMNLLMGMHWLKCYPKEECMAATWELDEKTVRQQVRTVVKKIMALKSKKIVWGGFGSDVFIITIDGVHCRIQEPRTDPGPHNYSHKSNSAGVGYELGISIWENRLVWIAGPKDASTHDLTIFRGGKKADAKDPAALLAMIPEGKLAITDSGYAGEAYLGGKVSISRDADSPPIKAFKNKAKGRHESFNGRLKAYNILDQAFRGGKDGQDRKARHEEVFTAVCIAVQYDLENGHPLMEMNAS